VALFDRNGESDVQATRHVAEMQIVMSREEVANRIDLASRRDSLQGLNWDPAWEIGIASKLRSHRPPARHGITDPGDNLWHDRQSEVVAVATAVTHLEVVTTDGKS